jgi:hypothetical protein
MRKLKLTNCELYTIVDDEHYGYLSQWNWQLYSSSGHVGRCQWVDRKQTSILLHRVVNSTPKGMHTDHINGNKLDNRKENLRTCNKSQNGMNRSKQKGIYSSGYKGVTWCKTRKKWKVRVKAKGKVYSFGYHTSEHTAGKTYNEKAKELHGEFFKPNDIKGE